MAWSPPDDLEASLVEPAGGEQVGIGQGEAPVGALLPGAVAAGHDAAEGLDVLVHRASRDGRGSSGDGADRGCGRPSPGRSGFRRRRARCRARRENPLAPRAAATPASMVTKLLASVSACFEGEEGERPVLAQGAAERRSPLGLVKGCLRRVPIGLPNTSYFSKCPLEFRPGRAGRRTRRRASRWCRSGSTVLTVPPDACPNSAGAEAASTWNSRTASWLKAAATPPVKASSLAKPSTMTWFERARWPAKDNPDDAVGPVGGVTLGRRLPG